MKLKLILLFLVITVCGFAQQKYLVFFKDKGITPNTSLNKSDRDYEIALSNLSEKSIERRKKILGEDIIRYEDLPVLQQYITEI